jgi:hypothetical protein
VASRIVLSRSTPITNTYGNQVSFEGNKVSPDIAQELGKNAIISVLIDLIIKKLVNFD